jgi:PhnB protein
MNVSPLVIVDNCEETLKFYQDVFGGEIKILNKQEDKVTFAHFLIDNSVIQIADAQGKPIVRGGNNRIYLEFDSEEDIRKAYDIFKADGIVDSELQQAFFGALVTALTDKYGVNWNFVYFIKK